MDPIEQEQIDLAALIAGDADFATVAVIREQKGDVDAQILQALSTLNEKSGKLGACVVVLQPDELPTNPDTPNPELRVRHSVQVFETPLFNAGDNGTGKDVFQLSRRIRQLVHRRSFGHGVLSWQGTENVQQADESRRSRMVTFERLDQELPFTRLGAPLIDPEQGGAVPQLVTLTPPEGATAYYTLDGSLPVPGAVGTTEYTAPFNVTEAATLRVAAYKSGALPSDVAAVTFT